MNFLYDILLIIIIPFYFVIALFRQKWHKGFFSRFGIQSQEEKDALSHEKNIWIHAVSVGEVLAISDLIEQLHKVHPDYQIICSTVTKTGFEVASQQYKDLCKVIYAPIDLTWVAKKYIHIIKPKLYIATETEIWPNLYFYLHQNKVPIVVVNGRISDNSFKAYKKYNFMFKKIISMVSVFCMQSKLDAQRIEELGLII